MAERSDYRLDYRNGTTRPALREGSPPRADLLALSGRLIVLAATIGALHTAGGALPAPHLTWLGLRVWTARTPPIDIAFTGIRVAAFLLGTYLLLVVLVAWLGEAAGHGPTRTLARRLLPRSAHGILALATGASVLAAAMAIAPAAGAQPMPPPDPATLAPTAVRPSIDGPSPGSSRSDPSPATAPPTIRRTVTPSPSPTTAPPTLRRLSNPGTAPTTSPGTGAPRTAPLPGRRPASPAHSPLAAHESPPTRASAPSGHASAPATQDRSSSSGPRQLRVGGSAPRTRKATLTNRESAHPRHPTRRSHPHPQAKRLTPTSVVVAPGDSFWSIASTLVTDITGRTPTTSEVAKYWSRLIEANRERLPVPGQPDLLFTGDQLLTPPML